MNNLTSGFLAYRLEVEWLMTWYPLVEDAVMDRQQSRSGTIRHSLTDEPFTVGNQEAHQLADFSTPAVVVGFITVAVNQDDLFVVTVEARLGAASRTRSVVAPPNTTLPYMVNVGFRNADNARYESIVYGSAVSLFGTIATGQRPVNMLANLMRP